MKNLTTELLLTVATAKSDINNVNSVITSLQMFGAAAGLDQPHRLIQYLAQLTHESGGFRYDRELWGPTPQQLRYERDFTKPWSKDDPRNKLAFQLGNVNKGDGRKFAGKGPIQLTGRGNVTRFYEWAKLKGFNPPNFVENPELINTDPWEGLAAIWYWDIGNPTGKSLNRYADQGDNEMITRRVNGGVNGLADRLTKYTQLGLAYLGYPFTVDGIKAFQTAAQTKGWYSREIDGDDGPGTRAAIHQALVAIGTLAIAETKPAPVTENVPIAPKGAEAVAVTRTFGIGGGITMLTGFFADIDDVYKVALVGFTVVALIVIVWKQELIASRVKSAIKTFGLGN